MPRDEGDPRPAEIVLSAAEARVAYLWSWYFDGQRIVLTKYLPDLPDLGDG
jgi:hypothetical protein